MDLTNFKEKPERTVYFDYLRVFATFAIIILHISAKTFTTVNVNLPDWKIATFYNSIVRWGVPVFVMISGSLFLNRDVPMKKMYSKYILRLVTSFVVWSLIYSVFVKGNIFNKLSEAVRGHYHMWFVLMIIGIYMCIPFIKPIIQSKNRTKYYLLLSFIFAFLIPEIIMLTGDFGNTFIIKTMSALNDNAKNMGMQMVLGFAGYFVLGYFLNRINLTKKQRLVIYLLGLFGFLFTISISMIVSIRHQQHNENYFGNFNVNILLEAIAVFTWLKYRKFNNDKINRIIQKLSKYSFGAYLIHALVIERFNACNWFNIMSFNSIASTICKGILVFAISFVVSAILNNIPLIKKYIV